MCRIDLCGQNGVKISSYGDTIFLKFNPLNRPWGRFLPREDNSYNFIKIPLHNNKQRRGWKPLLRW